jgi:ABC-type nickel/cobalt efflux system permease component RcnA
MAGVDQWLAEFGGGGIGLAIAMALLLGARHATDPDHLTAVSALILSDDRGSGRRAGVLGLSWGLGHATTLFLFGLPVVLFGRAIPIPLQQAAEAVVGIVIIALAVRLIVRWRRGYFHSHAHRHGLVSHTHPHVHEHSGHTPHPGPHPHRHVDGLGRSPLAAFGIGLIHGAGGSAAVGILLVTAVSGQVDAVLGLLLFAGATACSMALVSAAVGYGLVRGIVAPKLERLVPAFATVSLAFGVWYTLSALGLPSTLW